MSWAEVIYCAVRELMEGTLGDVRVVPMMLFGFGAFRGIPDTAAQALVHDARYGHRFDVVLGRSRGHASTPLSIKASARRVALELEIGIWTRLSSTAEDDERQRQRIAAADAGELAIQALMYPGNLDATSTGRATGIVSGMLHGDGGPPNAPRWEVFEENWQTQILRSRIIASAIVTIPQPILG